MAFVPNKEVSNADIKNAVIVNSGTIKVGDVIIPDATNCAAVKTAANTTGIVLGVVIGIQGINGRVLEKNSITVASNNETVGLITVNYIPSYVPMEYTADLSAAAGTTTGSGFDSSKMSMFTLSTSDGGVINEASAAVFSTQLQFFSFGVSSYSTTKVHGVFTPSKIV